MTDATDSQQLNDDLKKKVDLLRQQSLTRARTLQAQLLQAHAPAEEAPKGDAQSQSPALPKGAVKSKTQSKKVVFAMSKLSLLSITLSLMLLGALIFSGGFLTGYWIQGGSLGGGMGQGAYATTGTAAIAGGLNEIGFKDIAAQQAGTSLQNVVTTAQLPGVPDALKPFASTVQSAVGQSVGNKASQNVSQGVGKALSSAAHPSGGGQGASATSPQSQNAAGGGPRFTVQLGIFATQENAAEMVQRLRSQNYVDARATPSKSPSGDMLYTVQSGSYPDYETAAAVSAEFVRESIPGATVIQIKPQGGKP